MGAAGRGGAVLTLAAASTLGAGGICLIGGSAPDDLPLQRAIGAVGLGPAASADWSFFTYDPRIEASCEAELWPFPGGPCYIPHHGAALADLPPLERR